MSWMEKAACLDKPVEMFFEGYLHSREVYDEVNELCKGCPVRKICLNFGKATKSEGVWGGEWLHNGAIVETLPSDSED